MKCVDAFQPSHSVSGKNAWIPKKALATSANWKAKSQMRNAPKTRHLDRMSPVQPAAPELAQQPLLPAWPEPRCYTRLNAMAVCSIFGALPLTSVSSSTQGIDLY